ncbi:GntR family transcriptional regulator [Microbacterium immunditiarum]|uniref:DNA-binding GntR family transcriptional regulator n=1 Tax=Microbacterium immunditiarum TaxID=337480 RepID=A0A7Y9GL24_9MICO|nr:GntR family transcriptional regulator [Microbacterium immunditiarum]NYE18419.1 DNA-binding GntR family transcriptional regulator [Microbacterium immunditiarum]
MKSGPAKDTMAVAVRDRMRADILGARLKPGQRLMFAELSERYGVSVGVTREALTWLSSQGLVKAVAHQGYMVTPLSVSELDELTDARLLIEPEVLKLSIRNGDTEWEGRIVAAHHVLSRTPSSAEGSDPDDDQAQDAWAEAHAAYHEALFSACKNARLMQVVRTFSEEAALYRRWSVSLGHINHEATAEHRALLEHALTREAEDAAEVLRQHIGHTRQMLKEYVEEEG